jgi:hypothetical protein
MLLRTPKFLSTKSNKARSPHSRSGDESVADSSDGTIKGTGLSNS